MNLTTWKELVDYVQILPYGRNSNRSDFFLVLKEKKGTCSSKHALLSSIALENEFHDVQQILGIYKMTDNNTPGVGDTQLTLTIDYIPEAHSYLKIGNEYFDYTNPRASYKRIELALLYEIKIQPQDVVEKKLRIHQDFIMQWIDEQQLDLSLDEVWAKRESCIDRLSKQT